jgi:hypothetical protein
VRESLTQLSPFANVTFSSISANLLASSLSIKNISIQVRPDTIDKFHQHLLNFSKAEFSGVDFLKIIFKKSLSINTLRLEKGEIKVDSFLLDKKILFIMILQTVCLSKILLSVIS